MVRLTEPDRSELDSIRNLIDEHARRTRSPLGVKLLYQFSDISNLFVKVLPREYAHMIELTERLEASGLTHDEAIERAFEMRNEA